MRRYWCHFARRCPNYGLAYLRVRLHGVFDVETVLQVDSGIVSGLCGMFRSIGDPAVSLPEYVFGFVTWNVTTVARHMGSVLGGNGGVEVFRELFDMLHFYYWPSVRYTDKQFKYQTGDLMAKPGL